MRAKVLKQNDELAAKLRPNKIHKHIPYTAYAKRKRTNEREREKKNKQSIDYTQH